MAASASVPLRERTVENGEEEVLLMLLWSAIPHVPEEKESWSV